MSSPAEDPAPVPKDLNYNMWLGEAPFVPYSPMRTHKDCWRQIRDYAGGTLADWGAHIIDTAQVGNSAENSGPVEVEGEGVIPPKSLNTMPNKFQPEIHLRQRGCHEGKIRRGLLSDSRAPAVGPKSTAGAAKLRSPRVRKSSIGNTENNMIWPLPPGEHRDFLDCVKSRQDRQPIPPKPLHRLSTVMHIGNIAIELGRKLKWDPESESFGDPEADGLRSRVTRTDWKTG